MSKEQKSDKKWWTWSVWEKKDENGGLLNLNFEKKRKKFFFRFWKINIIIELERKQHKKKGIAFKNVYVDEKNYF